MNLANLMESPYLQEAPLSFLEKRNIRCEVEDEALLIDIVTKDVFIASPQILELRRSYDSLSIHIRKIPTLSHRYHGVELEINTHCNFRCNFCPVSTKPHKQQYMSMETFLRIIDQVCACEIPEISLNHYSEPTLSPTLVEMAHIAAMNGLRIQLFTNASGLDASIVNKLSPISEFITIVVNMPEATPQRYKMVTRSSIFSRIVSNIQHASGIFPLTLVVNNLDCDVVGQVSALFPNNSVYHWETDNRAGAIHLEAVADLNHSGLLNGCPLAAHYFNISFEGNIFLCAQDYHKRYIMGNINQSPLLEILDGKIASQYRRFIFGYSYAPDDFICRRCRWTASQRNDFSVGALLTEHDRRVYSDMVQQATIQRLKLLPDTNSVLLTPVSEA